MDTATIVTGSCATLENTSLRRFLVFMAHNLSTVWQLAWGRMLSQLVNNFALDMVLYFADRRLHA